MTYTNFEGQYIPDTKIRPITEGMNMAIGTEATTERAQTQLEYLTERIGNVTGRLMNLERDITQFSTDIFGDSLVRKEKLEKGGIDQPDIAEGAVPLLKDAVDCLERQMQVVSECMELLGDQNL